MPHAPTIAATALALLGAAAALWALFADRARGRRRCPRCWYDMGGVPSLTCPECGRTARSERRLFRTRRRYGRAALGLALVAAGAGLWAWNQPRPNGWWSLLPTPVLLMVVEPGDGGPGMDEVSERIVAIAESGPAGWLTERAFEPWIDRGLASEQSASRVRATLGIAALRSPEEAGPRLRAALADADPWVRYGALYVAYWRPELAAACADRIVAAAASDPEPFVQCFAVGVLGSQRLAPRRAVPVLAGLLRSSPVGEVRAWSAHAIGQYGTLAREAEFDLYDAAGSPYADARVEAVRAIPKVARDARAAVAALRRALGDGDPRVRLEAVRALPHFGPDAAPALPELRALTPRDAPEVSGAAFETIAPIEAAVAEAEGR